ncbi:MAG: ABC transporter substrate-binding protein [Lachnospiraceae bacterium]|nr:ABC transporter substrate-binding protein [Lachnospiraceae bacterium]
MKKRAIAGLLCCVMMLGLCACGQETAKNGGQTEGAAPEPTPASEETSLDPSYETTIYVCGSWGNFEALDAAAQIFNEQYPNIQVVYEQLENYTSDLGNRFVSGENIDIYLTDWLLSNDERYSSYWENAEDLTDVLDLSAIPEAYAETGLRDGMQFAVPIYNHSYGIMVNEDLLAAHDLAVPSTYEELLNCCEVLKAAGIAPVLKADMDYINQIYFNHVYQAVMTADDPEAAAQALLAGEDSTGKVANIVSHMDNFHSSDYIHPDSEGLPDTYDSVIMRFFEGDIAFVPFVSSSFSGTKKREAKSEAFTANPFSYSFIPAPGTDGYEHVVEQLGTVYMCAYNGVDEEKMPYVNAFLQFLVDDAGSEALARVKNMATSNARVGDAAFPYLNSLPEDQILYAGMSAKGDTMLKVNQLLRAASIYYEVGISAEDLLAVAIGKVNEK